MLSDAPEYSEDDMLTYVDADVEDSLPAVVERKVLSFQATVKTHSDQIAADVSKLASLARDSLAPYVNKVSSRKIMGKKQISTKH